MKKFVNNEKVTKVCETVMLNEDNKILRYCYQQKRLKIPFAIYVDF